MGEDLAQAHAATKATTRALVKTEEIWRLSHYRTMKLARAEPSPANATHFAKALATSTRNYTTYCRAVAAQMAAQVTFRDATRGDIS